MKLHFFFIRLSLKPILLLVAIVLLLQVFSCTKSTTHPGVNNTGTALLSEAGVAAAAAAGGKILFAGGYDFNADTFSRTVDIYDVSSGMW
ncbi:MAG TPA: hypothetical protein VKI61_02135 [Chitinophagaceae bacterium]|nr:hypothetical protein [Chitinophagaceae bacterium]